MKSFDKRKFARFFGGSVILAYCFWLLITYRVTGLTNIFDLMFAASDALRYLSSYRFIQFLEGISLLMGMMSAYLVREISMGIYYLWKETLVYLKSVWRAR